MMIKSQSSDDSTDVIDHRVVITEDMQYCLSNAVRATDMRSLECLSVCLSVCLSLLTFLFVLDSFCPIFLKLGT